MAAPLLAVLGVGGLLASLGLTSWALGASSSSGVELTPISDAPPSGALASPNPLKTEVRRRADHLPTALTPDSYGSWAAGAATQTGVPARALEAYAVAAQRVGDESLGCNLDWATLAGLGYVESLNGADGGGLDATGRPAVAIFGVRLDGRGDVAAVADTDAGAVDGDPTGDRAVGPLQFLPSTWTTWGSDADGDGVRDPQDIDDAAPSAARYLCVAGDLSSPEGWTAAVFSYNHSAEYVRSVFAAADQIAALSTL